MHVCYIMFMKLKQKMNLYSILVFSRLYYPGTQIMHTSE